MKLVHKTFRFETLAMLKAMREVSEIQIQRMREIINNSKFAVVGEGMTSFNFGRQAGHTEALVKQAVDDAIQGDNTLIVTHNKSMEKYVYGMLKELGRGVTIDGVVVIASINSTELHELGNDYYHRIVVGPGGKSVDINHILIDGPVAKCPTWTDNFCDNFLKNISPKSIKSCVLVGG